MKILIAAVVSFLVHTAADAAMVRVLEVTDGRSVVVDRGGTREIIRLAGVSIVDEPRAADLLRWTVGTSWVLAELQAGGDYLVYRSPDALFVNRELVLRGFARATQHGVEPESNLRVTYLGELHPPAVLPGLSASAPGKRSGKTGRSSAPPTPRARTPRARSRPTGPATAPRKP